MKRLIKKIIRAILCLWSFLFFFNLQVNAESVTMNFNRFATTSAGYSPQCNSTLCVVYNYPIRAGITFNNEWTTSYTMSCSGNTVISGSLRVENPNLTYDWLQAHFQKVYYVPNSGASTTCNHSIGSDLEINYSCITQEPNSNFKIGYTLAPSSSSDVTFNANAIIYRSMNITCDNTASAIIENDNINTDKIIDNYNNNSKQEREKIEENTDAINDLNDNITSEDEPTIDLSDVNTTSTTPISDLVILPATLLNSYLTAFSGTCSSYTLPLPFNHSVILPCFTISDYVGSSVANIIDMAICLFMAYAIVILFIRIFDDITTLGDTYTNWVKRGRF